MVKYEKKRATPSFFALRRFRLHLILCLVQHILNKDAVTRCRIVDENVGDRSHELAVL